MSINKLKFLPAIFLVVTACKGFSIFWRPIFFFNDPSNTDIYTWDYTLSLHDALPISLDGVDEVLQPAAPDDHRQDHRDQRDRKSTRLNSSHSLTSRMPSSA